MRVISMPPRSVKAVKYNRFSREEAYEICSRRLRPNKPFGTPKTCFDCYYHDGKCELGKEPWGCTNFKTDWLWSNKIRRSILEDYDWCLRHFDDFCQVDKELFVAIYGKKEDGIIYISNEKSDDKNE